MARRSGEGAARFEFEAVTSDGRVVRDAVTAADADDAMRQVRDRGLFVTTMTERGPSGEHVPAAPPDAVDEADEPSEPDPAGTSPSQDAPPLSDSSGMRLSLLRAKAKELADAYEALHYANRQPAFPWAWGGLFLGTLLGWLAGEALYLDFRGHSLGITFPAAFKTNAFDWEGYAAAGVGVGLVVWFVVFLMGGLWREVHRHQAKLRVAAVAADLTRTFPGPVAAWGGAGVLETEDTALAISRAVAQGTDPSDRAGCTLGQLDSDPDAKERFTRVLNVYLQEQRKVERAEQVALVLLLGSWPAGPLLGAVVGALAAGLADVLLVPNAGQWVVGSVVGLGVAGVLIWLCKRLSDLVASDGRRTLRALATDLEREYGPALQALGLNLADRRAVVMTVIRFGPTAGPAAAGSVGESPDGEGVPPGASAVTPLPDPVRQEVLIGRLKEHYKLLEERDEPPEMAPTMFTWIGPFVGLTVGGLLFAAGQQTNDAAYFASAFFLGVGGIGGSVWLGQYLGKRYREERQARLIESKASLEQDYAAQLAEWGGAGLLHYKVAVEGILRKLGSDPDW
jgi:hypothetical protein